MKVLILLLSVSVQLLVVSTKFSTASNIQINTLDVPFIPLTDNVSSKKTETPSTRIIGGTTVTEEEQHLYKHQVRMIMRNNDDGESVCGASVISSTVILTAAHCLDSVNLKEIDLYFGMLDEHLMSSSVKRTVPASDVKINPCWSRVSFKCDIAVIILREPLELNDRIDSIRLSHPDESCLDSLGREVVISGWGQQNNQWIDTNHLQTVTVNIIKELEECKRTWTVYFDPESMYCVDASHNRGACSGDSGGPMVYTQSNGLQLLLGLTSFGSYKGCESDDHRIFTCINHYRKWVCEATGNNEFCK